MLKVKTKAGVTLTITKETAPTLLKLSREILEMEAELARRKKAKTGN
jgi:hypothetical protein